MTQVCLVVERWQYKGARSCVYYRGVKVSNRLTHHCGEAGLSSGTIQRAEVLIILQISNVSRTLSLLLIVPLGELRASLWEH